MTTNGNPLDLGGRRAVITGASRGIGATLARTLVRANVGHPDEIRQMFATVSTDGPLDILIHNAAIGSFKPTLDVRHNQWDLSMGVNARALLVCTQEAAPLMEAAGGTILTVSSLGSSRVFPRYGAIGVSKAALESLVRYLAVELAPRRIRVNAVSAGLIDTAGAVERTPLGRLGTPEDVARVVLFLCSPLADWIVGQTIVADGGLGLNW
jgi:enoyl-[acyl-carrier protein] reductase III